MAARNLFEAITGRPSDKSIRDQVREVYGTNSRGGANTAAAAEDLGVSARTIQRWIKADKTPHSDNGATFGRKHTDWRNSAAGRAEVPVTKTEKQLRSNGGTIGFNGTVAISSDRTDRTVNIILSAQEMSAVLDALRNGDDTAAHTVLESALESWTGGSVSLTNGRGYNLGR